MNTLRSLNAEASQFYVALFSNIVLYSEEKKNCPETVNKRVTLESFHLNKCWRKGLLLSS